MKEKSAGHKKKIILKNNRSVFLTFWLKQATIRLTKSFKNEVVVQNSNPNSFTNINRKFKNAFTTRRKFVDFTFVFSFGRRRIRNSRQRTHTAHRWCVGSQTKILTHVMRLIRTLSLKSEKYPQFRNRSDGIRNMCAKRFIYPSPWF